MIKDIKLSMVDVKFVGNIAKLFNVDLGGFGPVLEESKELILKANPDATLGDLLEDDLVRPFLLESAPKLLEYTAGNTNPFERYKDSLVRCPNCGCTDKLQNVAPKLF